MRGVPFAAAGVDVREVERGSSAPSSTNRSNVSEKHVLGRQSGRSILLTTTIGLQADFQRLGQHEAGLRLGAFEGIDQHQRPVGHPQHAFDFAAEVGVARRVDDVDLHALVVQGDVLGENRDAAFPLQIVGVEDAVSRAAATSRNWPLCFGAGIDQRRLAVVDVGDDGDVANVVATHRRRAGRGFSGAAAGQAARRQGSGATASNRWYHPDEGRRLWRVADSSPNGERRDRPYTGVSRRWWTLRPESWRSRQFA